MIRTVLRTEHVTMQFGGVIAVNDLNIVVKEHEIIALIGPNGAGKTTAFNDITGVPARSRSWALPAPSRTFVSSKT